MNDEQMLNAAAILLLVLGAILGGVGIYLVYYYSSGKKKKCSAETTGTVVQQVLGSDSRVHPVVEYTANGKTYRRKNSVSITKDRATDLGLYNGYGIGQVLTVNYDPEKPTRWMINGAKEQKLIAIIFSIAGLVLIGLAAILYF